MKQVIVSLLALGAVASVQAAPTTPTTLQACVGNGVQFVQADCYAQIQKEVLAQSAGTAQAGLLQVQKTYLEGQGFKNDGLEVFLSLPRYSVDMSSDGIQWTRLEQKGVTRGTLLLYSGELLVKEHYWKTTERGGIHSVWLMTRVEYTVQRDPHSLNPSSSYGLRIKEVRTVEGIGGEPRVNGNSSSGG